MSVGEELAMFYFIIGFICYLTFAACNEDTEHTAKWWEHVLIFLIIELFWPLAGL